jgi:hypothetical protein
MPEVPYRLYLAQKQASSYTRISHITVNGSATDFIQVLENAARIAICKKQLGLRSTPDINLDVYQVPNHCILVRPLLTITQPRERLGGGELQPHKLREKLQETFTDEYRNNCFHFSTNDTLEQIDFSDQIIIVFTVFKFLLFDHLTNTYFGEGDVTP